MIYSISCIAAFYKTYSNSLIMPNKGKNKENLGHLFIDKMNSKSECIPIINSKEPLTCNCCSKISVPFHIVQSFFHEVIQTYCSTDRTFKFVGPGQLTTVEGYHLAHFWKIIAPNYSCPNQCTSLKSIYQYISRNDYNNLLCVHFWIVNTNISCGSKNIQVILKK